MALRRRSIWVRLGIALPLLLLGIWLISLIGVVYWEQRDDARPSAAIVVLGAAQYVGRPSPVLRARLDHSLELWKRGLAPRMIFTGGFGEGDTTSEAAVGQRYAIQHGVPAAAILIENTGRSTSESVQQVAKLMESASSHDVILVSDPFHMLRLSILARRYGLNPHTSPTRTSPISSSRRESLKYVFGESVKAPFTFFFERPN
jgi:uncharacterized SAM-binding protein YcdF (DUF218 family)